MLEDSGVGERTSINSSSIINSNSSKSSALRQVKHNLYDNSNNGSNDETMSINMQRGATDDGEAMVMLADTDDMTGAVPAAFVNRVAHGSSSNSNSYCSPNLNLYALQSNNTTSIATTPLSTSSQKRKRVGVETLHQQHQQQQQHHKAQRISLQLSHRLSRALNVGGEEETAVGVIEVGKEQEKQQQLLQYLTTRHSIKDATRSYPSGGELTAAESMDDSMLDSTTQQQPFQQHHYNHHLQYQHSHHDPQVLQQQQQQSYSSSHATSPNPACTAPSSMDSPISPELFNHHFTASSSTISDNYYNNHNWATKRGELEYNLSLLHNGIASDSYDDLKTIMEEIVMAAG